MGFEKLYGKVREEEEFALDSNVVKAERNLGLRKSGHRGFDIIEQVFFVEEDWFHKDLSGNLVSRLHKMTFDSFEEYYDIDLTKEDDTTKKKSIKKADKTECVTPDFIEQNVNTFDEIVKLIVIGAKNVGKSTFINKLTNSPSKQNDVTYSPTSSLEIKKVIKSLGESKVKIANLGYLWTRNLPFDNIKFL